VTAHCNFVSSAPLRWLLLLLLLLFAAALPATRYIQTILRTYQRSYTIHIVPLVYEYVISWRSRYMHRSSSGFALWLLLLAADASAYLYNIIIQYIMLLLVFINMFIIVTALILSIILYIICVTGVAKKGNDRRINNRSAATHTHSHSYSFISHRSHYLTLTLHTRIHSHY
jgi:hypothetical protein